VGLRNLRAICPNCGAKIHTQPKGLGHITWANSWVNVQTGKECPFCGVALTGKVGPGNRAEPAGGTQTTLGGFVKTRGR
jgi:ribosomal protein S27AE